jgi:3-phenylpropionate/trans-cinnamate dioxygenase ferredoxin reductase component
VSEQAGWAADALPLRGGERPVRVVVVGAGLAGLRTVEELRSAGFAGDVTLIGAESRPPYDRPPLSKQFMVGKVDDTTLRADLGSLGARIRLGERAALAADGIVVTDRDEYPFDVLVIATGALPVGLPGPGRQRFLRTADDALWLRAALEPGVRVAIVGAGWIGAELATAAASRGCAVTVVEAADAPLAGAVGIGIGTLTVPWYAEAGVDLRLGTPVASVQDGGLALAGDGWLPADIVVTAVGVRPDTGWLESSGIDLDNGVVVDGGLRASVPGTYAVGDCAAFWSRRFARRLRPEHWDVALRAPAVVAANVVAADVSAEAGAAGGAVEYDPVPYFWSEQFGRMLQYVGEHRGADQLVWRGQVDGASWGACWLRGERLVAFLGVGRQKEITQARRLIEAAIPVDPERLADPGVSLREAGQMR